MAHEFTTSYLKDSLTLLRQYKKLTEGAMAQVSEEQLSATLDDETNSIAIIVKHITGNMRSRFTDFLTSDGEKPSRDRDAEFENLGYRRITPLARQSPALVAPVLSSIATRAPNREVK